MKHYELHILGPKTWSPSIRSQGVLGSSHRDRSWQCRLLGLLGLGLSVWEKIASFGSCKEVAKKPTTPSRCRTHVSQGHRKQERPVVVLLKSRNQRFGSGKFRVLDLSFFHERTTSTLNQEAGHRGQARRITMLAVAAYAALQQYGDKVHE